MLNVKRWEPVEYVVDAETGEKVTFEVKRLQYFEAEPFKIILAAAFAAIEKASSVPEADTQVYIEALRSTYRELPREQVEAAFRDFVRNVQGLQVDGVAVVTGEGLFEVSDEKLVFFVLGSLHRRARLSVKEGKASSSQPTSASETTASSASPAPSIASEGGAASSTALESLVEPESSIAGV